MRIIASSNTHPGRCPLCREALEGLVAACDACGVQLHESCRDEFRSCPTLGCARAAQDRARFGPPPVTGPPAALRSAPRPARAGARRVAAAVVLGLLLLAAPITWAVQHVRRAAAEERAVRAGLDEGLALARQRRYAEAAAALAALPEASVRRAGLDVEVLTKRLTFASLARKLPAWERELERLPQLRPGERMTRAALTGAEIRFARSEWSEDPRLLELERSFKAAEEAARREWSDHVEAIRARVDAIGAGR